MTPQRARTVGTTSRDARRSERPGQRAANQITIAVTLFAIYLTIVICIATAIILAVD